MMKRILVANRGEIVCRIARTARRMGLTTIAVYSDADRGALHVREADEAFHLGPAPAAESYLNIPRILEVARLAKADAIHPGYGFLSENAEFARRCVEAGFAFVGPPASAILAMGSKSASKAAMAAVGVPVAPGYHGDEQSAEGLRAQAQRVGFPLIIKASAGGGGKGMQVVHGMAEVDAAIASAQRLARTAFGDERLLLERYFAQARHVEVQVFADTHGAVVALFDRDCSVQRRHQKIIEEAPAPGLRPEVRAAMSSAAITAARAVGYVGAGTVEFLVDEAQQFYFMEMNTRLQVEHPVTELVTGVDLVEWQIRVARGEALPAWPAPPGTGPGQGLASAAKPHGAAIEVRVYAEDPAHDYLPSVGRIGHLHWPEPAAGLRLDVGFESGDEVSPFYDPMLGKVIAWGESRAEAIDVLAKALGELEITGVATNRALLRSVLGDSAFCDSGVATDFLAKRAVHLAFAEPPALEDDFVLAALWCATRETAGNALWRDTRGWRLGAPSRSLWRLAERVVAVEVRGGHAYGVRVGGVEHALRVLRRGDGTLEVEAAGRVLRARIVELGAEIHVFASGRHARLVLAHTEDALAVAAGADQGSLLTPLPGTIVALHVSVGQQVRRGAPLVTVEAMKMEHTLTAPYDGVVGRVIFGLSDRVPAEAVLVELSPLG
jgi:3-methylcrotonyl-CoA carboxylase alpha subunit